MGITVLSPQAASREATRSSRENDKRQGDDSRQRLHPEYLAARGESAEHAGDDHAAEEEDLDRNARGAESEAPNQAGGEEAVVQALVGCQRLRSGGEIRGQAEGLQAERTRPKEHLEDEEVEVQERDQRYGDVGDDSHGLFPYRSTPFGVYGS